MSKTTGSNAETQKQTEVVKKPKITSRLFRGRTSSFKTQIGALHAAAKQKYRRMDDM
jgi:hypothetical protein